MYIPMVFEKEKYNKYEVYIFCASEFLICIMYLNEKRHQISLVGNVPIFSVVFKH